MTDYYRDFDYVSQSMLKVFMESPEMYRRRFVLKPDHPDFMPEKPPTDAMLLGSLAHAILLEQDTVSKFQVIDLPDRRGTKWKAEAANAVEWGKTPVLKSTFDTAQKIAESARTNPHVRKFLDSLPDDTAEERELELRWQGPFFPKKARPDQLFAWNGEHGGKCFAIIELKTTLDPTSSVFVRQYFDRNYHVQAAWYEEGITVSGANISCECFFHYVIAVRNAEPFDTAFYKVGSAFVEEGFKSIRRHEQRLALCLQEDRWNLNDAQEVTQLNPLPWMHSQEKLPCPKQ